MLELEEGKKINDDKNNIDKNKLKPIKRNTAIYQNIGKKFLNEESKEINTKNKENQIQKDEPKINEAIVNEKKTENTIKDDSDITNPEIKNKEKEENMSINNNKLSMEQNSQSIEKLEKEVFKTKKEEKKAVPDKKYNFKEQLNTVKLSKIPMKNEIEQKSKKIINNKPQNEREINNKKVSDINNNLKVKMNFKKENIEKEMNLLKAKKELKNVNTKNTNDNKKEIKSQAHLKNEPKVAGFKNIKEMIEQNLKRQRIMSNDNIKK